MFEYAARNVDGELMLRKDDDPHYPAARWAQDQRALGVRVQRRRIVVVDDWADLPGTVGR